MFKEFAKIILMATLVSLAGCFNFPKRLDTNRPLGLQPEVSSEIKERLVWKSIKSFPLYVSDDVTYRDINYESVKHLDKEGERDRPLSFTVVFPKMMSPPTTTVTHAKSLLTAMKGHLVDNGIRVVKSPCESCITVKVEFAENRRFSHVQLLVSTRLFYMNQEVARARDDWKGTWTEEVFEGSGKPGIISRTANQTIKEVFYVWDQLFIP